MSPFWLEMCERYDCICSVSSVCQFSSCTEPAVFSSFATLILQHCHLCTDGASSQDLVIPPRNIDNKCFWRHLTGICISSPYISFHFKLLGSSWCCTQNLSGGICTLLGQNWKSAQVGSAAATLLFSILIKSLPEKWRILFVLSWLKGSLLLLHL